MTSDPRTLDAGETLGRYVICERLGQGVAATVYLAKSLEDGRRVALKVLHVSSPEDVPVARLTRERELLSRLTHPGFCRVHELGCKDGTVFLAMDYVAGRTLESILSVSGYLGARRAALVFRDVACVLAAAHALEIIHRDIKPNNIMLRSDDSPVLLDLGLATGPGVVPLTAVGAWLGTFHYVAPEVLSGSRPTEESDIFSLGVTFYRALTGVLPFAADHVGHVAEVILRRGPKPPSALVPAIPSALDAVVIRALKLNPDERYDGAASFKAALDAVLARVWPEDSAMSEHTKVKAYWLEPARDEPTAMLPRPTAMVEAPGELDKEPTSPGAVVAVPAADIHDEATEPKVPRNYVPPLRDGDIKPRHAGATAKTFHKRRRPR